MTFENPSREHIKEMLANAGNIAVVGLSDKPDRHRIWFQQPCKAEDTELFLSIRMPMKF